MQRFRLSTLMLLIVIAALSIALVVHQRRAARREATLLAWFGDVRSERGMFRGLVIREQRLIRMLQKKGDAADQRTRQR
jgi:hypothetical protein